MNQLQRAGRVSIFVVVACFICLVACAGAPSTTGAGGSGGGTSGAAGTSGPAGTTGGSGSTGAGGSIGGAGAGSVGDAGTTGGGGGAGSAGMSGRGGNVGATGGRGGSTSAGGAAGTSAAGAGGRGGVTGAGAAGTGGQPTCAGAAYDSAQPPALLTLSGAVDAHDPAAITVSGRTYLVSTGLVAKTSTNLTSWQTSSRPFSSMPAWVGQRVPDATNLWAPDISFFGGTYHLYYAASSFGSNRSCIGHATRDALDSGAWTDHGVTLCSNMSGTNDNWNAIDPNVVVDDAGTPWLAFGSFWGGLKMVELDANGARADTMLHAIAARPNASGALEAPFVFKRCGYYYLFTSWDACCDGAYNYNIRVGRSTNVTGPYVDKAGVSLMQGGGTLVLAGAGRWVAPGHNAILVSGDRTYNVYHALDTQNNRFATLRIAEVVWDADGWPVSAGP